MHTLAIVIPIYKSFLDISERISLTSLFKNISHPISENISIFIMTYEGVCLDSIYDIVKIYDVDLKVQYFPKQYFKSTASYSRLLKSYEFYRQFMEYEYMLIFQTDVYMVRDNINHFLDLGYDYIGAPVVADDSDWRNVPVVGNGGCSLRHVSTFMDMTNPDGEFMKKYSSVLEKDNNSGGGIYTDFEDIYFCQLVYKYYDFAKARLKDAMNFAFDRNPDLVMKMNHNVMPTFIHAIPMNYRLWSSLIKDMEGLDFVAECEMKYGRDMGYYMYDIKDYKKSVLTKIVTYSYNYDRYLKDWIEYHLSVGINYIDIYNMNIDDIDIDLSPYSGRVKVINTYKTKFDIDSFYKGINSSYKDDKVDWIIPVHQYEVLSKIDYDLLLSTKKNIVEVPIDIYTDNNVLYDNNVEDWVRFQIFLGDDDRTSDDNLKKESRMWIKTRIPNMNIKFLDSSLDMMYDHDISATKINSYHFKSASEYKQYLLGKRDIYGELYTIDKFFSVNDKSDKKLELLGITSTVEVK